MRGLGKTASQEQRQQVHIPISYPKKQNKWMRLLNNTFTPEARWWRGTYGQLYLDSKVVACNHSLVWRWQSNINSLRKGGGSEKEESKQGLEHDSMASRVTRNRGGRKVALGDRSPSNAAHFIPKWNRTMGIDPRTQHRCVPDGNVTASVYTYDCGVRRTIGPRSINKTQGTENLHHRT